MENIDNARLFIESTINYALNVLMHCWLNNVRQ